MRPFVWEVAKRFHDFQLASVIMKSQVLAFTYSDILSCLSLVAKLAWCKNSSNIWGTSRTSYLYTGTTQSFQLSPL